MSSKTHRPPQEPPSIPIVPKDVIERAKAVCERNELDKACILAQVDLENASFDNFFLPLAHLENEWACESTQMRFWLDLSPHPEIRDASTQVELILNAVSYARVFKEFVDVIYHKAEELDPESRKYLEQTWQISNTSSSRRIQEIYARISQIKSEFDANLGPEDNNGLWFSEAELLGLPRHEIIDGLEKGEGANAGKFRATSRWDYHVVLKYAENPDVRKRALMGRENMCARNVPLFQEVIALRHQQATHLGYPNHAAYATRDALLSGPEAVQSLLAQFRQRVAGYGQLDRLIEEKRDDPKADDKTVYMWDAAYYSHRANLTGSNPTEVKSTEATSTEAPSNSTKATGFETSNCFHIQSTTKHMLLVFGEVFGLVFEKMDGPVWHEDVELYSVWDGGESGGGFSGYLYLDLLPRPGKIPQGRTCQLQPSFISRSGDRSYAVIALVYNLRKEWIDHHEALSVCHELGHCIHALVSRTTYANFHGYNSCSRDFTELPAMLCEQWLWVPETLERLSGHRETGKPQSDNEMADIRARQPPCRIDSYELALAAFDQAIYTPASQKDAEEMDLPKIYNDLLSQYTGYKGPDSDFHHGYATRNDHISSSPGTVYAEVSSLCFAELIWKEFFAKDPMNKEAGMRVRRLLLEPGGTQSAMDMLENLLGRKPNIEDLCKRNCEGID